ncbi:MAG: MinD/ParA family protein [Lachnospiraceae bacterium]|nr:MinD/ParA family protein [Lachnospiraceae bacterium]MDD6192519.1 MinD/ParA family protein [Lachnospiraceae bacterium]MDY4794274.1 MinD/ParA family protein [Pararoseburia sp.]
MDQAEQLRNVIKQKNQNNINNARILTITSGKGGVGKSNMAVNLAIWFRKMGQRVIILDADFGLANVEVMFGTVPEYNLSDLIFGGKSIRDIITRGPMDIGFISGGSGILDLNNLTKEQISYLVHSLSLLNDLCDVLIIDTGAGVSDAVLEFVLASPEVIMVTTPEPSSLTDSYSLLKALYKSPKFIRNGTNIHLVANKVNSEAEGQAVYTKLSSVVEKFLDGKLHYLGMIPADPVLEKAVRNQKMVSISAPNARSTKAFEIISQNLMTGDDKNRYRWGITQLFNNFINRSN